jgi:hypothetical protein
MQPIVRGSRVLFTNEGLEIQEAEDAETILDRDADDPFMGKSVPSYIFSKAWPSVKLPPWIQTKTGKGPAPSGAQMFK